MEAGFNVLCEKAFALNTAQVKAMIAKAKEKDVFLMEALWSRFNPAINAAKAEVNNGAIGNLKAIKADFCFRFDYDTSSRLVNKNLAGGALLDIGIYPIFLSYFFFGKPVRMYVDSEYYPNGADKNLVMLFDYENGEEAILNASLQYYSPSDGFLHGDEGSIQLHGRWHEAQAYTKFRKSFEDPDREEFGERSLTFGYEIDEVHECLGNGLKQSEKWTWQNSIEIMEIMDEIRGMIKLNYGEIEEL
jgi:predicted dehydrogenase